MRSQLTQNVVLPAWEYFNLLLEIIKSIAVGSVRLEGTRKFIFIFIYYFLNPLKMWKQGIMVLWNAYEMLKAHMYIYKWALWRKVL